MFNDSIDFDQFIYREFHAVSVSLNNKKYIFTCKYLKKSKVMNFIVTDVYSSTICKDYSLSYIIDICSFLNSKEKEYYKLKYV